MVRFIIIRHGYSKGNKEKRFSGQMDLPLDDVGVMQAESTAKYILDNFCVDSVYSSDLSRAYETVRPIADALNINVNKHAGLREVDVGYWQGMLIEDVEKAFPESFRIYKQTPGLAHFDGGESFGQLLERVLRTMDAIAEENDGKTVVVGTHGGVIRTLRTAWAQIPLGNMQQIPHVPNSSVTVVDYESGKAEFVQTGYNGHLADRTTEEGVK